MHFDEVKKRKWKLFYLYVLDVFKAIGVVDVTLAQR